VGIAGFALARLFLRSIWKYLRTRSFKLVIMLRAQPVANPADPVYLTCTSPGRERRHLRAAAEGATAPESLRPKDREEG
jgi:hypothetical protein